MGFAKWPHGSGEYFRIQTDLSRPFSIWGSKITKIFCFRVWIKECWIEWGRFGDHFWYSDRLVNSGFSGSYSLGQESLVSLVTTLSKYCLLRKGEKIGPRVPQLAAWVIPNYRIFNRIKLLNSKISIFILFQNFQKPKFDISKK